MMIYIPGKAIICEKAIDCIEEYATVDGYGINVYYKSGAKTSFPDVTVDECAGQLGLLKEAEDGR